MTKSFFNILILILSITAMSCSQPDWSDIESDGIISKDTITQKGYTLIFINKDRNLNQITKRALTTTFFKVYPPEVQLYNPMAIRKVILIIDPAYDGVAGTASGIIRINSDWIHKHPQDIDIVTHEVMHIVQNYPFDNNTKWIKEGIADYIRFKLGINNTAANWHLPDLQPENRYKDSYRVTARFFLWMESHQDGFVKLLDHHMRTKTYNDTFWKEKTGRTIDQLWIDYTKDQKPFSPNHISFNNK